MSIEPDEFPQFDTEEEELAFIRECWEEAFSTGIISRREVEEAGKFIQSIVRPN